MTAPLRIVIIGCGFMGRVHSNAYRQVNRFFQLKHQPVLKVACARQPEKLRIFADNWGWESIETDWRKVVEREDVDVIDICSPNITHHDIAVAAAENGKWVVCEKPLAMNAEEGKEMVEAVEKVHVPNMVWYNYRRVPAIALAKQLVDEERVGRVFHYRSMYLQDWTIAKELPQGGAALWRLDINSAGSGVTGDLLAHSIDTAMWLNGPITKVIAETETFIKERQHQETGNIEPVGIDDACMFLARFANGSMGTFESTRYARGRKNHSTFEVNGEDGSLCFDLENPQYLDFFEYMQKQNRKKVEEHIAGWRRIHVSGSEHPYMDHWWVPGTTIGYEHTFIHSLADFLKGVEEDKPVQPDFCNALKTQKVCDAVLQSASNGQWVNI